MGTNQIYDFEGGEFDWFLIDSAGRLALCSSAGFGEVPKSVLENLTEDHLPIHEIPKLINLLPTRGGHKIEANGPGDCKEFTQLAGRGLFVFDWQHWSGPYTRILVPENPLRAEELDETTLKNLRPIHTETLDLENTPAFQVADLGIDFVAGNTRYLA